MFSSSFTSSLRPSPPLLFLASHTNFRGFPVSPASITPFSICESSPGLALARGYLLSTAARLRGRHHLSLLPCHRGMRPVMTDYRLPLSTL
jgi:hypothetical protein